MVTQHLSATVRRTQILDAARRLFLSKGYEAADVRTAMREPSCTGSASALEGATECSSGSESP